MHPGFERLNAAGEHAVRTGSHAVEVVPREGGRWGASAVLLPRGDLAHLLDELTSDSLQVVGGRHWPSGRDGRAHLTVRALEPRTATVDGERVGRYRRAIAKALARVPTIELEFVGVALSPATVLACATSPDGSGDAARAVLAEELGADGWLEDAVFSNGRDPIWYCSLIHFAAPIAEPEALVAWAAGLREAALGRHRFSTIAVCSWEYDGLAMRPTPLG